MKNEYTMEFSSTDTGKLKVSLFYDDKYQKSKTFPILVTKDELRNPPPALEGMLLSLKKRFNDLMIDFYESGRSPLTLMFQTQDKVQIPIKYFESMYDYRLKKWIGFIDQDLTWGGITDELIANYHSFLESENIATNTIRTYLFGLKKALDTAKLKGFKIDSQLYANVLKPTTTQAISISIYLTLDELKLMELVELSAKLDAVRVNFLIGAYTGAPYSDFKEIKKSDISSGAVKYISDKTGKLTYVPLHPSLPALLKRYKSDISIDQMNRLLPRIGEIAGINSIVTTIRGDQKKEGPKWQFIKSNTYRKTFDINSDLAGNLDYIIEHKTHMNSTRINDELQLFVDKDPGTKRLQISATEKVISQEVEEELYSKEFLNPIEYRSQKPVKKEEQEKDVPFHQLNWIKSAIKTKIQDHVEEAGNPFTISKELDENILSLVKRTDPNSVFTIDIDELSKIEQDTIRSKEILSEVFGVEDKNKDEISVPKSNPDINFKIMALLLTQTNWSRPDVERICKENNVMIGSTLEAINDYSYHLINKIVIDEEDEKIYISTEYKEKLLCPKI
ncbi:MAG TPA: tellurite resistance TerB C-terminal domain-containing protein [Prolixibacteraceae bacterium]|nr:tellurite resistance TerB C-terminal domain-containing protein [Prolixibacteraceae bacterium]